MKDQEPDEYLPAKQDLTGTDALRLPAELLQMAFLNAIQFRAIWQQIQQISWLPWDARMIRSLQ